MSERSLNLLPPTAKARLIRRRFNVKLIRFGIVLLAIQLAAAGVLTVWLGTAREALALMEGRVLSLRANLQPFDEVRDQALLIADRSASVKQLEESIVDWPAVLAELSTAAPTDLSLTSFEPTRSDGKISVSLAGEAGSRASIITFRTALEQSPHFEAVTFGTSQITDPATGRVSFTLTALLAGQKEDL